MKATKTLETVYLQSFITPTKEEDIVVYIAVDEHSQYVFEPFMAAPPKTDDDLITAIKTIVENIFTDYNSEIHSDNTTIITNLPEETHSTIKESNSNIQQVIFNSERTEKFTEPILVEMFA